MGNWLDELSGLDGPMRLVAALINLLAVLLRRRRSRRRSVPRGPARSRSTDAGKTGAGDGTG